MQQTNRQNRKSNKYIHTYITYIPTYRYINKFITRNTVKKSRRR